MSSASKLLQEFWQSSHQNSNGKSRWLPNSSGIPLPSTFQTKFWLENWKIQSKAWKNQKQTTFKTYIFSYAPAKLYTPSTLNIDFIQWHTQLNVCAVKLITHDLIHDFHFNFQAYTLPLTLNGICVSLFKFHTWILKQF